MIDLSTGEIRLLEGRAVLQPLMTVDELLRSPLARYAARCRTLDERFEMKYGMPPLDLAGSVFHWLLFFRPARLIEVDLHIALEPPTPSWNWMYRVLRGLRSRPVLTAAEAKQIHDQWLRDVLGQTSETQIYYPWGKISSVHDRVRDGSWICIEYSS